MHFECGNCLTSHWRYCITCTQITQFNDTWMHYNDVIMDTIASQITSLTIVYSTVYSDADQRKHQSSASLAFVRGIHRGPVNSPHKWPVTRKMFPFDDVIMAPPGLEELIIQLFAVWRENLKYCDRISILVFFVTTTPHIVKDIPNVLRRLVYRDSCNLFQTIQLFWDSTYISLQFVISVVKTIVIS